MLITRITLQDFRQFKGKHSVEFSTDKDKNVTLMLGENGAGKTTFAQAFQWCLYGKTEFKDPYIINKKVAMDMGPNAESCVRVELELIHNNIPHKIIREQKYTTNLKGELNLPNSSTLQIQYHAADGQIEFLKPNEVELRIKEILPQDLSKYFFFDGERINNMSKELNVGKSEEFAEAVKRLLGLAAFSNTLNHLKGKNNANSVIKSYNSDYDSKANSLIEKYKKEIESLDNQIGIDESRKEEIDKEIDANKILYKDYTDRMAKFKESEKHINDKKDLEKKIDACKKRNTDQIDHLFCSFNKNILSWICRPLINNVVDDFSESNTIDKGIPDITANTIKFLLERKRCICGHTIEKDSQEYQELEQLLEYVPPKSLGTFIGQFVTESKCRIDNSKDYYEPNFKGKFGDHRITLAEIHEYEEAINVIDELLRGMENTSEMQKKCETAKQRIDDLEYEKEKLLEEIGKDKGNRERIQSSLNELVLKDDNNKAIATYKAYAQYMYDYLSKLYNEKETEVRNRLQDNINQIFKDIYDGKLSIKIDERYNITVIADEFADYTGLIETSTAQSMSVIFAFISGVIKMAKERKDPDDKGMSLESEAYPLVMDAPLSSFDNKRVKNVCDSIPKIAEQVIMFSFDKDGEIAKENMEERIGKQYEFQKKDEFETIFIQK